MTPLEKEIREIKRILALTTAGNDWLTPEKVKDQYGYSVASLRKFYTAGKISIKKGKSGKTILYNRQDLESLFITIPKTN